MNEGNKKGDEKMEYKNITKERLQQFVKICEIMKNEVLPLQDDINTTDFIILLGEIDDLKESLENIIV